MTLLHRPGFPLLLALGSVTTDGILAEARAAVEPGLDRTRFPKPAYARASR
jgi:acyl dehydratase